MRGCRWYGLVFALGALSCSEKAPEPQTLPTTPVEQTVAQTPTARVEQTVAPTSTARGAVAPERTPGELDAVLRAGCSKAAAEHRSLLLDFGANWCSDCRKLHAMKAEPPLRDELQNWELVEINITDADKHADVMATYEVRAIARWVVLRPTACTVPLSEWPRGPTRVVEPTSSGNATAQELVAWLRASRG